jgi:hypothetical protein
LQNFFSGQAATVDLLEKGRLQGHHFDILAKPVKPEQLITVIRAASRYRNNEAKTSGPARKPVPIYYHLEQQIWYFSPYDASNPIGKSVELPPVGIFMTSNPSLLGSASATSSASA